MKNIIKSLFICFGLFGCASEKAYNIKQDSFTIPKAKNENVINYDGIQLTLPKKFEQTEPGTWVAKNPDIIVVVINDKSELSLEDYVVYNVSAMQSADSTFEVIKAKKILINKNQAVALLTKNNKVYVLNLVISEGAVMHNIACGGSLSDVQNTLDVCVAIMDSVEIK